MRAEILKCDGISNKEKKNNRSRKGSSEGNDEEEDKRTALCLYESE